MRFLSKHKIAAMIAGTFIMAAATSPFIAQASEIQQPTVGQHQKHEKQHQISPEQASKHLSAAFGIDQSTILHYNANGMSFKDISHAAFLANASGKSINDVISHKTVDNTWKDVSATMGITKEQLHVARQNMIATGLNKKIGLDKQSTLDLLNQGYHPQDIAIASQLAKNTHKSISEVLSMKQINNRWVTVANTLGVDKETFKNDMKALGHNFGPRGHRQ